MEKKRPSVYREARVPGVGTVINVHAPFHEALKAIRLAHGHVINSSELAAAQLYCKRERNFSLEEGPVYDGIVYTPGDNPLIVRISPLVVDVLNARDAVRLHTQSERFYLDQKTAQKFDEQCEEDAKKDLENKRVLRLKTTEDNFDISTKRFADDELTRFLFEDNAKDYGALLSSEGIEEFPIRLTYRNYVNRESEPFVEQLYSYGIERFGDHHGLISLDLNRIRNVRGVIPPQILRRDVESRRQDG
jgi:hypothetical protein